LPWTESRSRDEWLSEVRRRGERIRRRRRLTATAAGAFALVLPLSAVTGYLAGQPERGMELSVAGPAPVDTVPPDTAAPQVPPPPAPPADVPATTTTTMPPAGPGRGGAGTGAPPPTIPAADDPVVRSTPTTTAPLPPLGTAGGGGLAAATPLGSAEPPPGPATCVESEFSLTLTLDKKTYGPGEPVNASSTLEKRSPGTCLLPDWWLEIILINSAGTDLTNEAGSTYSSSSADQHEKWVDPCRPGDCRRPVDPGPVFSATYRWGMFDCRSQPAGPVIPVPPDGSNCHPFPPGTYTVVAEWKGAWPGSPALTTFQIGS
jgi:hypothetical protein